MLDFVAERKVEFIPCRSSSTSANGFLRRTGNGGSRGLLIAWLASMISLPIVQWLLGERGLDRRRHSERVLQASLVVLLVNQAAGWPPDRDPRRRRSW